MPIKRKDKTGYKYGKLTILRLDEERTKATGRTYWWCQCECGREKSIRDDGLVNGRSKSCGQCANDYTNKKFGKLTALQRGKTDKFGHIFWICKCDCGNIVEVKGDDLIRNHTQSCGCLHKERMHQINFKDLTGQKFGKLTPLNYFIKTFSNGDKRTVWECQCDCGNKTLVQANNLSNGHTQSCGCITYSIGESNIAKILKDNNIKYYSEYVFNDLPNRRYDFYLPDLNIIIEFDGPQHKAKATGCWNQTEKEWEQSIKRDKEKNEYCLKNNIPLYRIPYEYRDKLTLELLTNEKFLVKEEM